MKGENLIHVKFDYSEALESKKEILQLQKNLIQIARIIKQYSSLRSQELKTKLKIQKLLKEVKFNIGKLQKTLPEIEVPEIKKESIGKPKIKGKEDESLEAQLREIQNRLRTLDR